MLRGGDCDATEGGWRDARSRTTKCRNEDGTGYRTTTRGRAITTPKTAISNANPTAVSVDIELCYRINVSGMAQTSVQRRWRHLFGLMLYSLLFFFAVGAKTALYHPQQDQVRTLTSTKVWQNTEVPPAISLQVAKTPVLLDLAVLLLMAAFAVTRLTPIEQPFVRASIWFSPSLSVRPPPSL